MTHATIEAAQVALETAALDVRGDMGEEAVEAGWSDLVHSIAADCTPAVAARLLQRNGLGDEILTQGH